MYYPNQLTANFCTWLLTSGYQRFSNARRALFTTVRTAAQTGTSVTTEQWNNFVYVTANYYQAYQMFLVLQPAVMLPSTLDSLTVAWLAVVTSPTQQTIYAVDSFFKQLRADGNLFFDYFFLFAQDNQTNANISLFNPTLYTLTQHNSPTWNANLGYTGNGTNSYLSTNFIDSVNGVNYTRNSAFFGTYTRLTVGTSSNYNMGSLSAAGQSSIQPYTTAGQMSIRINSLTTTVVNDTVTFGSILTLRTSSSAVALIKNGVQLGTNTNNSTGLSTVNDYFMCLNNNGVATGFNTNQFTCAFKGNASVNQILFNSALNLLMTNIGAHY